MKAELAITVEQATREGTMDIKVFFNGTEIHSTDDVFDLPDVVLNTMENLFDEDTGPIAPDNLFTV